MRLFEDKEYVERLHVILDKWNGANFKMSADNPYREIDCGRLIARVFRELGVFCKLELPDYTPKCWYQHNSRELLLDSLEHHINNFTGKEFTFKKFSSLKELLTGDILVMKSARSKAFNHIGIVDGNRVFSADVGGVKHRQINTHVETLTYRIYKCQQQQA